MKEELDIRLAAFRWLAERETSGRSVFSGKELAEGFIFRNRRITLKGQTGIWFPQGFSMPISITTRLNGPYKLDSFNSDRTWTYAYRGEDPNHRDNRGLREAMRTRTPLIYFIEVYNHYYQAVWPLIIIQDFPTSLCVKAMIEPAYKDLRPGHAMDDLIESPMDVRRYVTVETRRRLHQNAFREQVIHAYDEHCAICNLHHPELLDAAHIIRDSDQEGIPIINNGLSLCKIHHAAYDQNFIGIDQDSRVHVRRDILIERDGPMLKHGLQELDGWNIRTPQRRKDRPDPDRLALRFKEFLSA